MSYWIRLFGVAFSSLPSISSHDKLQIMTSRTAALPSQCCTNKNLPFDKQGWGQHQHVRAAIPAPIPCSTPSQLRNHTARFSSMSITSPAMFHLWVNTTTSRKSHHQKLTSGKHIQAMYVFPFCKTKMHHHADKKIYYSYFPTRLIFLPNQSK